MLFNIISFLLTFIKTNIEQRAVYTPTRDTLHFDIKKQHKIKPKPTQTEAQRRKREREEKKIKNEKEYPRDIFTFKDPSLITAYHRHVCSLIFLQFSVK